MAKAGFWLRGARGKLAGAALQKGADGKTIAREIVTPRNPRTEAQARQRMLFATVSAALNGLKTIVDHSWEGVKYGSKSNQEFVRRNIALLRAASKDSYTSENFNIKGVRALLANPYQISAGSLGIAQVGSVSIITKDGVRFGGQSFENLELSTLSAVITSADDYAARLRLMGLTPGDQLSVVALSSDNVAAGSYGNAVNVACYATFGRVVFKPIEDIDFNSMSKSLITDGHFTEDFIEVDKSVGNIAVSSLSTHTFIGTMCSGAEIAAACLVRSQKTEQGTYLRSNAWLSVNTAEYSNQAGAKDVYPSYMNIATDSESPYFLNQPEVANPT